MHPTDVGEAYDASTTALEAARGQRLSLRRALGDLEAALDAPAEGRRRAWAAELERNLAHLETVFSVHIEVTEGPGGLYEEIIENAPRLSNKIERFKSEHVHMAREIAANLARLRAADEDDLDELTELRARIGRLLEDLRRHRKRGANLVYEAYAVDIGGES